MQLINGCQHLSLNISLPSGIGAFQLHVLTLRRPTTQTGRPSEVVVSDNRGRVVHVTHGLASSLGLTKEQLMCNNSPHALEKVMAQPFAQMHRALAQVGCFRVVWLGCFSFCV